MRHHVLVKSDETKVVFAEGFIEAQTCREAAVQLCQQRKSSIPTGETLYVVVESLEESCQFYVVSKVIFEVIGIG